MATNCTSTQQPTRSFFFGPFLGTTITSELPCSQHAARKAFDPKRFFHRLHWTQWDSGVVSCRHLEYNSLTEVNSGSLYGLTSLQQLFLGNNSIARINADGWKFCQRLREL